MNLSSWFRRSVSKGSKNSKNPNQPTQSNPPQEEEEELLGVTEQLLNHLKSFTLDTFKNFPLQDDDESGYDVEAATSSAHVRKDLSGWQERHAFLVLSKSKELSQLRFRLCPRYLKEQKFWRIYFMLVHSYVAEYELHAIQLAKLKSMAMENEERSNTSAYEVEMAETKQAASSSPSTP
ncbi:putative BSD domain-containing protein [Melia azedarach]|uniref:BSD domain-containing protein n=2 Tax=Melia azedarach TaxID=155640 RepID=A0ACC1YYE5_MELAZ|nr:putative BSD domain-containing protein [Melia azedarach]KAJ4728491.1 putative BSD domain-containing protein [Melia azedarach]